MKPRTAFFVLCSLWSMRGVALNIATIHEHVLHDGEQQDIEGKIGMLERVFRGRNNEEGPPEPTHTSASSSLLLATAASGPPSNLPMNAPRNFQFCFQHPFLCLGVKKGSGDGDGNRGGNGPSKGDEGKGKDSTSQPSPPPPTTFIPVTTIPQASTSSSQIITTESAITETNTSEIREDPTSSASSSIQSAIDTTNASVIATETATGNSTRVSNLTAGQIAAIAIGGAVATAVLSALPTYLIMRHRKYRDEGDKGRPKPDSPPRSRGPLLPPPAPRFNFPSDNLPAFPTYATMAAAARDEPPKNMQAYQLNPNQGVLPPPRPEHPGMMYSARPLSVPGPDGLHATFPVSPLSPADSSAATVHGRSPSSSTLRYPTPANQHADVISPTQFSLQHFSSSNQERNPPPLPAALTPGRSRQQYGGVEELPPPLPSQQQPGPPPPHPPMILTSSGALDPRVPPANPPPRDFVSPTMTATTNRGSGPGHMGWLLGQGPGQGMGLPPLIPPSYLAQAGYAPAPVSVQQIQQQQPRATLQMQSPLPRRPRNDAGAFGMIPP